MTMDAEQSKDSLSGCNRATIFILGTILAPVAAGFALGVAVVTGGEVLFGLFNFPYAATADLPTVFLMALMTVLLAGILVVLSLKR